MGWRDLIVTSHPHHVTPNPPIKGILGNIGDLGPQCENPLPERRNGSFGDFGDIGPRYENKSSLSIDSDSENSTSTNPYPISPKLTTSSPDDPVAPLEPGWLVAYYDRTNRLRGGCDERDHGTVARMEWGSSGPWTVWLTNGEALPLLKVRSVARTNAEGVVVSAWTVRPHGHDGEGGR